jgi:hypothetical protein
MSTLLVKPEHPLKKEFDYYVANQDELVQKYAGRVVVIKDKKVIGNYASELDAVQETAKTFPLGTFLVQKCAPGKENYTATFHSRVVFG